HTGAVDSEDHYRRADDDDEDEDEDQSAERGKDGLAAAPTPGLAGGANGPGVNGLAFEEAAQFVGKFFRGRVTAGRFLLQAFQADGLQIRGHAGIKRTRRHNLDVK